MKNLNNDSTLETSKNAAAISQDDSASTALIEGSELGNIKIHENVIASIVRKAVVSVEGVSRLAGNSLVDNIAEFVGSRRMQARAIAIEMNEDNRVSVEIKVNLKFGYNIPEVASNVQQAVIQGLECVTGMTVTKVDVLVQEVEDFEEDSDNEISVDEQQDLPLV